MASDGPCGRAMEVAIEQVQKPLVTSPSEWEESYRPLPYLFLGLLITWLGLVFVWTVNTWTKRRWQVLVLANPTRGIYELDWEAP